MQIQGLGEIFSATLRKETKAVETSVRESVSLLARSNDTLANLATKSLVSGTNLFAVQTNQAEEQRLIDQGNYRSANTRSTQFDQSVVLVDQGSVSRSDFNTFVSNVLQRYGVALEQINSNISNVNDLSFEKAQQANAIKAEYISLSTSNPDSPRVKQLSDAYTNLAGWPPVPPPGTGVRGGDIQGLNLSQADLVEARSVLEKDFAKFQSNINNSVGAAVIEGNLANPKFNPQDPLTPIPDQTINDFDNTVLSKITSNSDLESKTKSQFLASKPYEPQEGIDESLIQLGEEKLRTKALVKIIQAQDDFNRTALDLIK